MQRKYTTKMEPIPVIGDILWLDTVNSTNDAVRERLESLDNLSIIAAENQLSGRGQGDHLWISEAGMNLTFSIALRFGDSRRLPARDEQLINGFVTPAICSFLSSEGVISRVKKPNDIYVGDRKICGILVENILEGQYVRDSIVGVGLNLNQTEFPSNLPNPVSLRLLTGKRYDTKETLLRLRKLLSGQFETVFG